MSVERIAEEISQQLERIAQTFAKVAEVQEREAARRATVTNQYISGGSVPDPDIFGDKARAEDASFDDQYSNGPVSPETQQAAATTRKIRVRIGQNYVTTPTGVPLGGPAKDEYKHSVSEGFILQSDDENLTEHVARIQRNVDAARGSNVVSVEEAYERLQTKAFFAPEDKLTPEEEQLLERVTATQKRVADRIEQEGIQLPTVQDLKDAEDAQNGLISADAAEYAQAVQDELRAEDGSRLDYVGMSEVDLKNFRLRSQASVLRVAASHLRRKPASEGVGFLMDRANQLVSELDPAKSDTPKLYTDAEVHAFLQGERKQMDRVQGVALEEARKDEREQYRQELLRSGNTLLTQTQLEALLEEARETERRKIVSGAWAESVVKFAKAAALREAIKLLQQNPNMDSVSLQASLDVLETHASDYEESV